MEQSAFERALGEMPLFPPAVLTYARSVSLALKGDEREQLLLKLQAVYAAFEPIERERIARLEANIEELLTFNKQEVNPLRRSMEASESEQAAIRIARDF